MSVRIRSRVRGQANKTVVDPMKFMMDSGILFHMNHCVLHPLGLAIVGNMTKDGLCFELVDRRTNPNTVFADEDIRKASKKLEEYMKKDGRPTMELRKKLLGFVIQPIPE